PTGCRRCGLPTSSSSSRTGGSWSAERTSNSWPEADATPSCTGRNSAPSRWPHDRRNCNPRGLLAAFRARNAIPARLLSICPQWEDLLNDRLLERASRGARDSAAAPARKVQFGSLADDALPAALPGTLDRDDRGRPHQPRRHRGDPADDQSRDRRPGAAPEPAGALDTRRRGDGG